MNYCCKEFENNLDAFFYDGNAVEGCWSIAGCCGQCEVVSNMKFCPYCGAKLKYPIDVCKNGHACANCPDCSTKA